MILIGVLRLLAWLFVIPAAAGCFAANLYKGRTKTLLSWVSGQMLLWAVFFGISIPLILKKASFQLLVDSYRVVAPGIAVCAVFVFLFWNLRKDRDGERHIKLVAAEKKKMRRADMVFAALFLALLVFQLVMAFVMAYSEGDDAYYVAAASVTENSDTMYQKNIYSVGMEESDSRHALAPFPMWIAFLSRISGIRTVIVAHIAVSAAMILMANVIFFLIGGKLFKDGRKYLFMFFVELLILFGDYSVYTTEKFLIARSRQGKAALSAVVLPCLFLIFLLMMEAIRNKKRIPAALWILLLCTQISGILCSTQGGVLCCMFTAITGICIAVSWKKWKILIPLALSCVPAAFLVFLYMRM